MPDIVEVAAGLVFNRGRLLIAQRPRDKHLGGLWEFPGGKTEPGETLQACLIRELKEELGIGVTILRLIDRVLHTYPEKSVALHFFVCRLETGEAKPLQCQAVAWVKRSELGKHEFPAADAKLLQRLQRDPRYWREEQ